MSQYVNEFSPSHHSYINTDLGDSVSNGSPSGHKPIIRRIDLAETTSDTWLNNTNEPFSTHPRYINTDLSDDVSIRNPSGYVPSLRRVTIAAPTDTAFSETTGDSLHNYINEPFSSHQRCMDTDLSDEVSNSHTTGYVPLLRRVTIAAPSVTVLPERETLLQ